MSNRVNRTRTKWEINKIPITYSERGGPWFVHKVIKTKLEEISIIEVRQSLDLTLKTTYVDIY